MPKRFRIKKKEQYENPDGDFFPVEMISETNILKEFVSESLCQEALQLSEKIRIFREKAFNMMDFYKDRVGRIRKKNLKKRKRTQNQDNQKSKKKQAGYTKVTSFSGKFQVNIDAPPFYTFGDGFQTAKELMAEVIHENITGDFQKAVRKIFDQAFAMDREGQVKLPAIMRLMDYHIPDERWQRAKSILIDELRVLKRQSHISFRFRDEDGKLQSIPLDISRV